MSCVTGWINQEWATLEPSEAGIFTMGKKVVWISFFLLTVVVCTGILLVKSFTPKNQHTYEFVEVKPEISLYLDSMEKKMWHYYAVNPDSAEILLNQTLRFLDSINLPQKQFYPWMQLVELYQYRKPDYEKAAECLNKAVLIFIKQPSVFMGNPYIMIDIGNIFLYYQRYGEAINFYNIANDIANATTNPHPRILSLQNIGMAYSGMGMPDSTLFFLRLAGRSIQDTTDMVMAQNDLSIAACFSQMNQPDSIFRYAKKSLNTLNNFQKKHPEMNPESPDVLFIGWSRMEMVSHKYLMHAYLINNQTDSSVVHFNRAMEHSRGIGFEDSKAGLFVEMAMLQCLLGSPHRAMQYADSVISINRKLGDGGMAREHADSLARIMARFGVNEGRIKFEALTQLYDDSLRDGQQQVKLPENDMILTSVAIEQAIEKVRAGNDTTLRRNKMQLFLILVLLVVVAIILIALHIYLRQKRTIEKAYQELAGRISRNIRLEDEIIRSQARDQGTTLQLAEKLEFRMQQDKPYLNGDLTVNDLAAMLNTNQTYISNLLNQQCGLNFNEYINQQRVKEFCRLIDDGAIESLSIDQLSEKSGFKTRSTFYTAFRKFTGMTPAAFISARKEICVQLQSSVS